MPKKGMPEESNMWKNFFYYFYISYEKFMNDG